MNWWIFFIVAFAAAVDSASAANAAASPTIGDDRDSTSLRGGDRASSQKRQLELEEDNARRFAGFWNFMHKVQGWFHQSSSASSTTKENPTSHHEPNQLHSDGLSQEKHTYPDTDSQDVKLEDHTYPDSSSSLAVQLEPQKLKDEGKIATIVGGNDADPNEAPFFAMMLTYDVDTEEWKYNGCGGTLVSDRHVLTAGHCAASTKGRDKDLDAVYIHAYQPFFGNPGVKFHYSKVESYTVHPSFDDGPNDSDLAIVTMSSPLDINDFPPVQLAPPSFLLRDGDMVNVYGFGRMSYSDDSRVNTLQKVTIPFISRPSCLPFYGDKILSDMVCAGDVEGGGGRDACGGDSGGPMIVTSGYQRVYQTAVISWGDGCADATKVSFFASCVFPTPPLSFARRNLSSFDCPPTYTSRCCLFLLFLARCLCLCPLSLQLDKIDCMPRVGCSST